MEPGRMFNSITPYEFVDLVDESPKDKPWDKNRAHADLVAEIYATETEFQRLGERITACSGFLLFSRTLEKSTGETGLKLKSARFCRVRHCPVCQWRRSMMWKARMFQALPELAKNNPNGSWLLLTLTQQNCDITNLKETVRLMNLSWQRLLKRKEFTDVKGWVRSLEVTRGNDRSAHPHFHCLLFVSSSYFNGDRYVSQARWVQAWKESARLNYTPIVDIRKVRAGEKGIEGAVAEVLKYTVKATDMIQDGQWFIELTRQLHRVRSVASGGICKDLLKEESTQQELITPEGEQPEEEVEDFGSVKFDWHPDAKKYRRPRSV
jgi:plasmid rolling circle replication initiator protein Rep